MHCPNSTLPVRKLLSSATPLRTLRGVQGNEGGVPEERRVPRGLSSVSKRPEILGPPRYVTFIIVDYLPVVSLLFRGDGTET
jgi:hypothetical protein